MSPAASWVSLPSVNYSAIPKKICIVEKENKWWWKWNGDHNILLEEIDSGHQ